MCLDRPLTEGDNHALHALVEDMQRGGAPEHEISRAVAEATCVRRYGLSSATGLRRLLRRKRDAARN
jgi:hypothetical protein